MSKENLTKDELTAIYKCYIRPMIEFVSVVYHCLINSELAKRIENMQKEALGVIYGCRLSYKQMLRASGLEKLTCNLIQVHSRPF